MTKYVLNSGYEFKYPEKAKSFMNEVFSDNKKSVKILIVNFAQRRNIWESKFEKIQQSINAHTVDSINIEYELAFPFNFEEQCRRADIIYIQGGEDNLLKYYLDQFTNLEILFANKTVVTSSAGSNYLSSFFWTCDWRSCFEGSGILHIKFLPHYQSDYGSDSALGSIDWDQAVNELTDFGHAALPIHALEEGNFVVITK